MIAPVRDLEAARNSFEPLRAIGYEHRDHRPDAHAFQKPADAQWWAATHSLHLAERESEIWRERITFRNTLRAGPELAAEYQEWKLREAQVAGEPTAYAAYKLEFVSRVLAAAGVSLKQDVDRLSPVALAKRQRY